MVFFCLGGRRLLPEAFEFNGVDPATITVPGNRDTLQGKGDAGDSCMLDPETF